MRATPETIWRVPAYLPYLQPALTEQNLARAEKKIGYKLPKEYVALLRIQNGGYIRYSLPDSVHDVICGIGPNYPSLIGFSWDECREYISFPLDGLVPFDGDGHWHLCLDYRHDPLRPSVTYADVECDREAPVASSFAEYLTKLVFDVDGVYALEGIESLEIARDSLSAALGASFDPPDTWAHGYPTYRAALGTARNPQWIFVSPNRVMRGFVRDDEPSAAKFRRMLPGEGLRYPEVPEVNCLVGMTDGARSRVLKACAVASISLRPLRDLLGT